MLETWEWRYTANSFSQNCMELNGWRVSSSIKVSDFVGALKSFATAPRRVLKALLAPSLSSCRKIFNRLRAVEIEN